MKKRISRLMMAIFVIATTFQVFPITNPGVSKVLANDSGWAVYEAEAEQCGGYAVVKEDKNASGGAVVSRIGAPNTDLGSVTFDIYAPKDGTYDATIKYISQNSDSFYVLVNNQEKIEIKQGVSVENKATAPGISNIQLNLKGGSNRVKVYSDKSYALDLDCIIVKAEREKLENVYESSSAKLSGDAKLRRIYKAQDGYGIAGLGTHGSAEFDITSGSGTYTLGIWYSAADYRGLEVYVDNNLVETLYCPITAEDFNIETITTDIDLSAGRHKIKFTNKYSTAPDIDKIQLIKTEKVGTSKTSKGIKNFGNKHFNIKYNMETGKADLSVNDVQRVKGIESVVKLEDENKLNTAVKSSDYTYRRLETKELNDGYGKGKAYTVISNSVGIPEMRQNFYVYDEKPYALISVELSSPNGVKSNFMAPITAMGDNVANIGNIDDGRSMFVPYDNDAWVRYRGDELSGVHTSYWTTSVYDNTSRNSIVMGSVDHDTWKSGTSTYSADSKNVNFLGSFGGIWSAKYTYDYHPHGSIDGTTISSPKMFIGYFEDWRDGMETYGEANNCNVPMLKWESGVPFGYNSWYGQGSKVNYKDSCDV
ncbi:MAG: hypothetical protein RSC29_04365, partial [Oscillospiraceae bacterium]